MKDIFKTAKGKYVAPAPIEDPFVLHPDIEACAVSGANLAQPLALVMLSADATARTQDSEARAALQESLLAHLKQVNAGLEPHEKLGLLVVVTTPWTPENGFVTPTFKVKRNRIDDAYASRFEAWEASGRWCGMGRSWSTFATSSIAVAPVFTGLMGTFTCGRHREPAACPAHRMRQRSASRPTSRIMI